MFGFNMRALIREPLLHFLLIGLALFVLYDRVSPGDDQSRRIVVTEGQVGEMASQFQSQSNRPPTSDEMHGLIEAYVRDEITYREGLAMGLDQDDAVIRRRIRQKYDLIAEEENRAPPTEADLLAYLKAYPAKFVRPTVVSFDQLFFDPISTRPETVNAARTALTKGADPAVFGQPSLLPRHVEKNAIDLVERDFGEEFAQRVVQAPVSRWVGPVASAIGVHLIRVTQRSAPELPTLNRVRTAVEREWENDNRIGARDADYRKLRAQYDVIVRANPAAGSHP